MSLRKLICILMRKLTMQTFETVHLEVDSKVKRSNLTKKTQLYLKTGNYFILQIRYSIGNWTYVFNFLNGVEDLLSHWNEDVYTSFIFETCIDLYQNCKLLIFVLHNYLCLGFINHIFLLRVQENAWCVSTPLYRTVYFSVQWHKFQQKQHNNSSYKWAKYKGVDQFSKRDLYHLKYWVLSFWLLVET